MKFPNALKGVKKIFTGELLVLIGTILSTVSMIVLLLFGSQSDSAGETGSAGMTDIGLILFSGFSTLLMAVALIFSLIGVIQCSKDVPVFKGVIFVMLLSLAVEVVSVFFTEIQIINKLSSFISSISGTITIVLIVIGIGKIAEQLGDDTVFAKGQTLLRVIIWIALLTVIMNAISAFVPYRVVAVIEIVMLVATGVLEVIQYILYIVFLGNAKKMLQNANDTAAA